MIKEQRFENISPFRPFSVTSEYFPIENVWHCEFGCYNEYNTEQEMRVDILIEYIGSNDYERHFMRSAEPMNEDEVLDIYDKHLK